MHQIEVSFPGGKKTSAHMNGFEVVSDQPRGSGGEGSAPSPFDYFLLSIASCAGYYALAFCQSRDIPTDDLKISFATEFDRDKKLIGKINIKIITPPEFPSKYADAILKSVDQCSVKRHLVDPPEISVTTELK